MAIEITNWNIKNNITWYVRIIPDSFEYTYPESEITVELYLTEDDAYWQINLQSTGVIVVDTTDELEVILTDESSASESTGYFMIDYGWHLKLGNFPENISYRDEITIKITPFVDLPEISNPIYRNYSLIIKRAEVEVNSHTKYKISKEVSLAEHVIDINCGDIVKLNSDIRNIVDEYSQLERHVIVCEKDIIVSHFTIAKYQDMVK